MRVLTLGVPEGGRTVDLRKWRVLRAIVDDYIQTAEPVGSRTVARKYGLEVSAATIRNEMADLEDMGYLEQPHTSAGRVPSDKGYRFYVDTLLCGTEPMAADAEAVRQVLAFKAARLDQLVRQAAHLLSEATDFLAVATQPGGGGERLAGLQVVPLHGSEAVVVLVGDDGRARTKVIRFAHSPSARDLEQIGRALSERLRGQPLRALAGGRLGALAAELGQFREVIDRVKELLAEPDAGPERVVVDGATNLLKQPEFREVASAQRVLQALERDRLLGEMLGLPLPRLNGLEVAIGREIPLEEMADCSLVTAVYAAPGGVMGRIGVLGPRRMDYTRVMRLVEGVAGAVTKALGEDTGPERGGPGLDAPPKRSADRRDRGER